MKAEDGDRLLVIENLKAHLAAIVRERDPYLATAGHFYVRQYIRQQFQAFGEVVGQEFIVQGRTYENLILNLPGQNPNRAPILVAAHYDAVPGSPGADDNASGVAVLLELARSFHAQPAKCPIRLVAFDLEETRYELAGSTFYAHSLQGEALRLMLSLECLGYCDRQPHSQQYPLSPMKYVYPNTGDFIGLIGNLSATPDLIRLSHSIRQAGTTAVWLPVPQQGRILPTVRRSDHAVFWDLGYRAMMVTDTAPLRNPHYHLPGDRRETLDLPFMAGICDGLAAGLRNL